MDVTRRISVVDDPRFMDHLAPEGHPERQERLLTVSRILGEFERQAPGRLVGLDPRSASDEELLRIHGRDHIDRVEAAAAQAPIHLDPDTYLSPQSAAVARLAAGSCSDLALRIASGSAECGFAALRPPGHHAEGDHAMGFCLFNNVAIAARALQAEAGVEKLLILDWDVHHGNGTQHSFESDASILYISTHQFPFYPGTGAARERGIGRGEGATVNIPLPAGCGDDTYIGSFHHIVVPVVRSFRPEMILVSCGFDAHASDPLASMQLGGAGFLEMTRILLGLADELCGGRILFVLEGGYAPQGLAEGTAAVLSGLLEPQAKAAASLSLEPALHAPLTPGSDLFRAVSEVAAVHRGSYRNISCP